MELEFKRQDGSWHACRILFSSDPSLGMAVSFKNCKEEEIISNREDISAKLRFRSAFLQAGECSKIKENECVLALHDDKNPSENLFFDAIVDKINRVRHSDRLLCRCTFEVRFLAPHIKDQTVKVPSSYIMRLSDKEIESHMVFKAFLESTTPRAKLEFHDFGSSTSENESDLNLLLEKQVEEISKLAEGVDCSTDIANKIKQASQKGVKKRGKAKLNGGRIKQEINPDSNGNKSFLSPLAARAALASLTAGSPGTGIQKELQFPVFETEQEFTFPDFETDQGIAENRNLESGSEKPSVVVPRRMTRSSARKSLGSAVVNQKENENKKCTRKSLDSARINQRENDKNDKNENNKCKSVSPSIDITAGSSTDIIPPSEGIDAEIQPIKKKKIISSKKEPTRSSTRLSSLHKTRSQN